jgi:UrcA family protein
LSPPPLLPAALPPPAFAAEETVSVTVPFADLDVANPAGADVLTQRIDSAVEKVCNRPDMRDLKAMGRV